MTTSSTMTATSNNDKTPVENLPQGFTPGDRDVVIGKGKKFYKHEGNRYLREVIHSLLDEYSMAQTKPDKSEIISGVVSQVRQTGRFVKRCPDTGAWVVAEDLLCREKCSQCFRDALSHTYRSSNVAKKNKRRRELELQFQQEEEAMMWNQEVKRMRLNPIQEVAPVPISQHLFDWDISPMPSLPKVCRRASDLTGNMVSLLADAFGRDSNDDVFEFENPFEPTPLPLEPAQDNGNLWEDSFAKNDFANIFDPKPLFEEPSFEEDFSLKSDFMDCSFSYQPRQQQIFDNAGPIRNIPAAFAA